MLIMYGTKVLRKKYGEKQELCPICHNHTMSYLRTSTWIYILLPIPLIPVSFKYYKHCEFCDSASEYKKNQLMAEFNKPAEALPEINQMDLSGDTRQITISRKSHSGKGPALDIYIETQLVAKLEKNEPAVSFKTDLTSRALFVKLENKNKVISNVVFLTNDSSDAEYQVSTGLTWENIILSEKNEKKK